MLKEITYVAGLFFLMAGLSIAALEYPTFANIINPLYIFSEIWFYLSIVLMFLSMLIKMVTGLLGNRFGENLI